MSNGNNRSKFYCNSEIVESTEVLKKWNFEWQQ